MILSQRVCGAQLIKTKDYINEVELLFKNGYNSKQIAEKLNIGRHTVYTCFKKLGIKCQTNVEILSKRSGNKSPLWAGFKCVPHVFFYRCKQSAIKRSIDFDLNIEDIYNLYILQNKKCKLSNIELHFGSQKKKEFRNSSLDRINSDLGYYVNNIQLIDSKINIMKKDFSLDHFYNMCNLVVNPADNYFDYVFNKEINVNLTFRVSEQRAKNKKFDFDIKRSDLIYLYKKQNKRCAITNLPIEFKAEYRKPFFNQVSIDRINSDIGYIKSNIQLVIKDINFMKHKLDLNEFKDLCNQIINHKRNLI